MGDQGPFLVENPSAIELTGRSLQPAYKASRDPSLFIGNTEDRFRGFVKYF